MIAIDCETSGTDFFHGCKPFMVTACTGEHNYVWEGKVNRYNRREVTWQQEDLDEIADLIEEADGLVLHNSKFDVRALSTIGLSVPWEKVEDTLIASHLACSGEPHNLKYLAFKYLDYYNDDELALDAAVKSARLAHQDWDIAKSGHPSFPGLSGAKVKWHKMDMWLCMEEVRKYACTDVEMTWLLWRMYEDLFDSLDLWEQYRTRMKLLPITYNMESVGLNINLEGPNGVYQEIKRLTALKELMRQRIQHDVKLRNHLDLTKVDHMHRLFFEILELPVYSRTAKTNTPSLNKEAIEFYLRRYPDIPAIRHYEEYRKCGTKIGYLESYIKWVADDGRIHSTFVITGTRETRQATWDPNVQNIATEIKHIFGPPPGYVWIDFDLVNIELRLWTYQVGNKELVEVFEEGGSVHLLIASIIHREQLEALGEERFKETPQYGFTKNGNFALIYGARPRRADLTYKREGAYAMIADRFPEVPAYTAKTVYEAETNDSHHNAPQVTCIGGYPLDVDMSEPFKACNYKIQGSAGYIIGEAMINIDNSPLYHASDARMVNQVHDSIVIEVKEEHATEELISSLQESIEAAGLKYLPTCKASYKLITQEN